MVVINFVGDIMLGDSFHMLGIGVGSTIFNYGNAFIFEKIVPFLKQADINVGNLECVFSDKELDPKKNFKPYMTLSPNYVSCLKEAGFNILNMANNHTMQYGIDAFNHTEQILIDNNIKPIGTIRNPYCICKAGDTKFAFLGYSFRPNRFKHKNIQYIQGDRKRILDDVQSLSKDNDHVIISLHWGDEYIDYPNQYQITLAHEIIDAGATMIIGHHPHILQGIEYYKKGVIAYSLGNFVFDKPQELQKSTVILQAIFSKKYIDKVSLIPVYINSEFQPEIAQGKKKEFIEELLINLNKKVTSTNFDQRKYDKDVTKGLKQMRLQYYIFLLMNFYRYRPKILFTLIRDAILRRLNAYE